MEYNEPTPHLGSLLGGDVEIPQSVSIKPFIKARMVEIEALTQLIETPSNNVLLKKQFPKHMRRRAMSQNVKRIPKRLREHTIDMREKSGIREVPIKRPRRKHRRRPQNLLSDYNRRQREFVWLETHIWHAKRFHMIEKWGYKLPHYPNDKSYRSCYRATSKHCLIQDISFYCCIELFGLLDDILKGLRNHTNNECGLTFDAKHMLSGSTEGSVMFFSSGKYPYGAIGEIKYMWKPHELLTPDIKVLWLWSHPSFYSEVLEELIKTYDFERQSDQVKDKAKSEPMEEEEVEPMEELSSETPETKSVETIKLETRNVPFTKTPKFKSKINSVQMILLKDSLNRFRLTGPLSQALITSTFKEIHLNRRTNTNDWCNNYRDKDEINKIQLQFWEKLKSVTNAAQLPPKLVLGLIAVDPRFTMPVCRNKAVGNVSDFAAQSLQSIESGLSYSPIWSSEVRDEVTKNKLSTHQLNEFRSNKLVTGLDVEINNDHINDFPAIPCLFLQRPGTHIIGKPLGYSSGWDIIVPAGYGQPVWLGLIMHGGRAGGLKENASILREAGMAYLPPDTNAGKLEDAENKKKLEDMHFRLPPAKRQNYIKLGFITPFHCPWKILINDWTNKENESFFVLRNIKKLFCLKNKLMKITERWQLDDTDITALVGITVTLKGKGTIGKNAYICIPCKEDLEKLKDDPNFIGPVEEQHEDDLNKKRRELLKQHQQKLRNLARKRHKERKNGKKEIETFKSDSLITEHASTMKELWMPECTTIKDSCSRTVMGFVTDADFSFTNAKCSGVGYVCLKGLENFFHLVEQFQKNHCILVRNSNTYQYRFAYINIIYS